MRAHPTRRRYDDVTFITKMHHKFSQTIVNILIKLISIFLFFFFLARAKSYCSHIQNVFCLRSARIAGDENVNVYIQNINNNNKSNEIYLIAAWLENLDRA